MDYFLDSVDTPLGQMILIASTQGLSAALFDERFELFQTKQAQLSFKHQSTLFSKQAKKWLKAYFSKSELPSRPTFDLHAGTFYLKAWQSLQTIPTGQLITYGELANRIGYPKAYRAIGGAMNKNPLCLLLPCHRVIGSNGSLTGYGAGLERKKWLLEHEGALLSH